MTSTTSLTAQQARTANRLNSASDDTKRALRAVIQQATVALESIDAGLRVPHGAASLGRTTSTAVEAIATLDALLESAATVGLSNEVVGQAYRGQAPYFAVTE